MMTKDELRKSALKTRRTLNIQEISDKIVKKIKSSLSYKNAKKIMLFYPLSNEINLLELLNDGEKEFYLPRIQGEDMVACPFKNEDKLALSNFKTQEPTTEPINTEILDIIFIPALTVDKNFNRIGYGKGFYDRFLSKNTINALKIVPIPSKLIIDNIPTDSFDTKFDEIVNEL